MGSAEQIEVRRLASRFFDWRSREIEGILCVFRDLETKSGEEYAVKMCAAIGSAFPKTQAAAFVIGWGEGGRRNQLPLYLELKILKMQQRLGAYTEGNLPQGIRILRA